MIVAILLLIEGAIYLIYLASMLVLYILAFIAGIIGMRRTVGLVFVLAAFGLLLKAAGLA